MMEGQRNSQVCNGAETLAVGSPRLPWLSEGRAPARQRKQAARASLDHTR